jgi:hypothetical protein
VPGIGIYFLFKVFSLYFGFHECFACFRKKVNKKTLGCPPVRPAGALCYQGSAKAWPVVAAKAKAEFKGKRFFLLWLDKKLLNLTKPLSINFTRSNN